jgi:hypothetical protein
MDEFRSHRYRNFTLCHIEKKFEVASSDGLPDICAEVQPFLIDSGPIKLPQRCTPASPALREIESRKNKAMEM